MESWIDLIIQDLVPWILLFNDLFHWLETGKFLDIAFDFVALTFTACAGIFLFAYHRGIRSL
jgi:hypothetical protein